MIATNPETRYVPMTVEDTTRERIKRLADRDGMKMARLVDAMAYGWEMLTAEQRVAAMRGETVSSPPAHGSADAQDKAANRSAIHDQSTPDPASAGPDIAPDATGDSAARQRGSE